MRGFKALYSAQTICAGHGFVRNIREGFYRLGIVLGDPRVRRLPRLMVAWNEITGLLQAV
jgi:hypothetical protein